jgi:prephenate dehydratase
LGDYLFFIDFLGHLSENKIQEALQAIEAQASYFKLLGSYKIL